MIDPTELAASKSRIVDVISGMIELRRTGRTFKARCPFHSEKTPSFIVDPERQFFHCFGCGEHGDALDFLQRYRGLTFRAAAEALGIVATSTREERRRITGVIRAFEKIDREKRAALEELDQRRADWEFLSRCLTKLMNGLAPMQKSAWMFTGELLCDQRFEEFEAEREEISTVATAKKDALRKPFTNGQ